VYGIATAGGYGTTSRGHGARGIFDNNNTRTTSTRENIGCVTDVSGTTTTTARVYRAGCRIIIATTTSTTTAATTGNATAVGGTTTTTRPCNRRTSN
jgi:hypothetical protein